MCVVMRGIDWIFEYYYWDIDFVLHRVKILGRVIVHHGSIQLKLCRSLSLSLFLMILYYSYVRLLSMHRVY